MDYDDNEKKNVKKILNNIINFNIGNKFFDENILYHNDNIKNLVEKNINQLLNYKENKINIDDNNKFEEILIIISNFLKKSSDDKEMYLDIYPHYIFVDNIEVSKIINENNNDIDNVIGSLYNSVIDIKNNSEYYSIDSSDSGSEIDNEEIEENINEDIEVNINSKQNINKIIDYLF